MNNLLFVGLGNPGAAYQGTRHNVGADMLRAWVESMEAQAEVELWHHEAQATSQVAIVRLSALRQTDQPASSPVSRFLVLLRPAKSDTVAVHCLIPAGGMNVSGESVAAYLRYHPLANQDITLVHDDLELPLGELRLVPGGSAKGHNGVRSIHTQLNDQQLTRLRIGIGRPEGQMPIDRYVLGMFTAAEQAQVAFVIKQAGIQLTAIAQQPSQLT